MNPYFKTPEVYFVGFTAIQFKELNRYLTDSGQEEFGAEIQAALSKDLSLGEILCSFYAKACYAALTTKKNKNISRVRSIEENILGTIKSGHGSVFEHCQLNFMITNCSRVFTHELVRHRVGTAFSQTSGRYVRCDKLNLVVDPILEPVADLVEEARDYLQNWYKEMEQRLDIENETDFDRKKKLTSAMRRLMPNGQTNEIGFSVNLRSLRHTIVMRTSRHAEWEIRHIFNRIYDLVHERYPAFFADAQIEKIDGLREITFQTEIL